VGFRRHVSQKEDDTHLIGKRHPTQSFQPHIAKRIC